MAHWDVFHSDRLELERGLGTAEVRAALARGDLTEDDLIRPGGVTAPWARIGDAPPLPPDDPAPPDAAPPAFSEGDDEDDDFEIEDDADRPPSTVKPGLFEEGEHAVIGDPLPSSGAFYGDYDLSLRSKKDEGRGSSSAELITEWADDLNRNGEAGDEYDPLEEDEAAAEFTLSRNSAETVEELDLAAMVDVAFQLVLFFLVTATTILYKTLEVPKPNPESSPTASAAQGRSKTLDELKDDFILVEIDAGGLVKIDREPVPADLNVLAERLRAERERTGRKAMLLSADFSTPHKSAVLAYDAANEIGLGIALARPSRAETPPAPPPRAAPG